LLRAFASGCTAMTCVEAVSNGVGAFREPRVANARITLTIIVVTLGILLGGIAYLTMSYGIMAMDQTKPGYQSVLSQLVAAVMGRGVFYYVAIASALCLLCLSANTSFVGFPRLCQIVAQDGFLPQPFALLKQPFAQPGQELDPVSLGGDGLEQLLPAAQDGLLRPAAPEQRGGTQQVLETGPGPAVFGHGPVRVAVVDAREDNHLWGHTYRGKRVGILDLQDQIARDVAANLRLQRYAGRPVLTWWQGGVTPSAFGLGVGVIALLSIGIFLLAAGLVLLVVGLIRLRGRECWAALVGWRGVSRKLSVRGDETLADLHQLLQFAFEWDDDHLYCFWLSDKFWDRTPGIRYGDPFWGLDEGEMSSRVRLAELGLKVGDKTSYLVHTRFVPSGVDRTLTGCCGPGSL